MTTDTLLQLKVHEYFRGVEDEALREIAAAARVTRYETGEVVHEAGEVLTDVCFVVTGRIKAVRVDDRGGEHFFRVIERDEQFGLVLGAVTEPVPVRGVALEPTTVVRLGYEQTMDLTLKYPSLRRHWLATYARGMRREYFGTGAVRSATLVGFVHQSAATRQVARAVVERLRAVGEDVGVVSDSEEWRAVPGVRFRYVFEGGRRMTVEEVRRQFAEWNQADRIVLDILPDPANAEAALEGAHRVFLFARPAEIQLVIDRLLELDVAGRGWSDKIGIVWLLDPGSNVSPAVPQLRELAAREYKVSESPAQSPWGRVLANGVERLVHALRDVRIGVALGGGAARGMAHLGVMKALEQNGIVVDTIAGTSSGAMTGVIYSAGLDPDYTATAFERGLKLPWLFRHLPSGDYWYLLYKYRRGHFEPMLREYLRDWRMEQLPIPCMSVTCDLVGGRSVTRRFGDATHNILESINLPVLSKPICREGEALIDGALMNNIPADVLVSQGCNFVIAVSVTTAMEQRFGLNQPDTPTARMRVPSSIQTILRSLLVQNHSLSLDGVREADVVIAPDVTGFELSHFMKAREIAAVGEQAALRQVPEIKKLLTRLDPKLFRFDS